MAANCDFYHWHSLLSPRQDFFKARIEISTEFVGKNFIRRALIREHSADNYPFIFHEHLFLIRKCVFPLRQQLKSLLCIPGQRDNHLDERSHQDEFHELNYYNGRGASSRELYDSQHSRIAPLASRLLGLSFPTSSPPRVRVALAQDTSPSSIHYARTNAVFIQRSPRRIHVSRPHLRDTKPSGIVLYGDII